MLIRFESHHHDVTFNLIKTLNQEINMENIFNYKSFITNENDISKAIKKITEGDIQTY